MRTKGAYDTLSRVVRRITAAQAAAILLSNNGEMDVLGADGLDWSTLDSTWSFGKLNQAGSQFVHVENIAKDQRLKGHPIRLVLPGLKRLLLIPIRLVASQDCATIVILDPNLKWPMGRDAVANLSDLRFISRRLIEHELLNFSTKRTNPTPTMGWFEPNLHPGTDGGPLSRFLLETLVTRLAWHSRNSNMYVTLRQWRAAIKSYQITALTELKAAPPSGLVQSAGEEIARAATAVFGSNNFDAVVSVPCGHSKAASCFSSELGRFVADYLGIPFINEAFKRVYRPGKSHPRKNGELSRPTMTTKVTGTVLLVDDVATTGRHLELAAAELRKTADHVVSIAWIGGKPGRSEPAR